MLKTPKFWVKKNLISFCLLPVSGFYLLGFYLVKIFARTTKISKPVICIGNAIAGGSGKTPVAIAIGKILREMSVDFAFLSRGYMSDGSSFLLLTKGDIYKAEQVGDEPLLLAEIAPTFVTTNKLLGAKQLEINNKFQAVVLDDGMQSNSLFRDYTILVVDGKIGFGNGFLIPAGPMRETLGESLNKANLVVVIGNADEKLLLKLADKKIAKANIIPINIAEFSNKRLLAFCGLAYPEKFFSLLTENKVEVIKKVSFADHYPYKDKDLENICKIADENNLEIVTTKKDWVKFTPKYRKQISYLDIELVFEDEEIIKAEFKKIL